MFSSGDVVVIKVRLREGEEPKKRLAIVMYEDLNSVVVAAVTGNPYTKGIPLTRREGAPMDSLIKLNYIFTMNREAVSRPLFRISSEKRRIVSAEMLKLLSGFQG